MLFKRKNSPYWWFDFTTPDGQRIRQSSKTSNKRQAQELVDKLKADSWDQSKLGAKPKYSWKDAVVKWVQEATKKSIGDDVSIFKRLDLLLADCLLTDIDRDKCEQVINYLLNEGLSAGRVNRICSLIRAVLRKAEREWGWIDKAPAIRRLRVETKRIRWITKLEAQRLLRELPEHLEAMVRFSLATGLRESNVTGLGWDQIDMQKRIAWIHPDQAKAGKAIGVPLTKDAIYVLRNQVGKHHIKVFTYKGNPVEKAGTAAFKKALTRAGITDFRWHDLRHTWASWHVQAGTTLNVLQELGGWSDYSMVLRYAHLAPEHLAEHANNIGTLLTHLNDRHKKSSPELTVTA